MYAKGVGKHLQYLSEMAVHASWRHCAAAVRKLLNGYKLVASGNQCWYNSCGGVCCLAVKVVHQHDIAVLDMV